MLFVNATCTQLTDQLVLTESTQNFLTRGFSQCREPIRHPVEFRMSSLVRGESVAFDDGSSG